MDLHPWKLIWINPNIHNWKEPPLETSFLFPLASIGLISRVFHPFPFILLTPPLPGNSRRRYLAGGPSYLARQVLADAGTSELLTGPQAGTKGHWLDTNTWRGTKNVFVFLHLFMFTPIVGEMYIIQFDEHIFHMSWLNHQKEKKTMPNKNWMILFQALGF